MLQDRMPRPCARRGKSRAATGTEPCGLPALCSLPSDPCTPHWRGVLTPAHPQGPTAPRRTQSPHMAPSKGTHTPLVPPPTDTAENQELLRVLGAPHGQGPCPLELAVWKEADHSQMESLPTTHPWCHEENQSRGWRDGWGERAQGDGAGVGDSEGGQGRGGGDLEPSLPRVRTATGGLRSLVAFRTKGCANFSATWKEFLSPAPAKGLMSSFCVLDTVATRG